MRPGVGLRWRPGGYRARDSATRSWVRRTGACSRPPTCVAQWLQICGECLRIDQPGMLAEELQLTGPISGAELCPGTNRGTIAAQTRTVSASDFGQAGGSYDGISN